MSLQAKPIKAQETGYEPFFRFLDAFNNWDSDIFTPIGPHAGFKHASNFQPSFDLRELDDAYELHGELPGIDKENVSIEFAGPRTLMISGKVERSYQLGAPPKRFLSDETTGSRLVQSEEASTQHKKDDSPAKEVEASDKPRTWIAERSVGHFSRTFNFPQDVQQDESSATLKNGILNLRVPKAGNHKRGKIEISD